MHLLSKSTYMRGRQCPKALWLYKQHRELLPPVDAARQAIYDTGTAVGLLAQGLFPGGVDCTPETPTDFAPALAATQRAIAGGARVIYEAAFLHEGVLAALDMLVKVANGWTAYEVKSSSSAKEYQWQDAALQAHVIEGCGVALADVCIVHLNAAYVRQGPIDVRQLFSITSVKQQVDRERPDVPARIDALKAVLRAPEAPAVDIGPHCTAPFACDFMPHCWAHVPAEGSVFDLTRAMGREWDLYRRGILLLKEIPDAEKLTAAQRRQVEGAKHGTIALDRPALRRWLGELRYPLHHLDFETIAPAVPLFDGTRPYQQLPFQYSLHVQRAPGAEPVHSAFLADGEGDPREAFVQHLLADIGPVGDVLAYNATFEKMILTQLARDLPQHADALGALLPRIKDLHTPFKAGWYVVPDMNGRTSIKVVLPALVPGLGYGDLAVQEGDAASRLFLQLVTGRYQGDPVQLRTDLLAYCGRDTEAMVAVLGVLEAQARG
ncbi:MAG TPA: DUF2779 domain-containing protein [Flavobacteriales bacterium]|nr:DUF2779 domain-containing protein [Flavobacteriales bacterium]HMR28842.1 DUF2779 domain-containing protein [Flavobacteriales bacterium]